MTKYIYLDNQATTPLDPKVMEIMMPFFTEKYGNAASHHKFGRVAKRSIWEARNKIASLLNASHNEVIFTSGATEAINFGLKGIAEYSRNEGNHIITVKTEHQAVLSTCAHLEKLGFQITYLDVQPNGLLYIEQLEKAVTDKTILVSVMHANNEIGVIQPIEKIGQFCKDKRLVFFVDGAQSFGKIPVNVRDMNIDLFACSAHKLYGPKGVGALYIRKDLPLSIHMDGGGQEFGFRSGTANTPGIVGFGKAADLAVSRMERGNQQLLSLRNYFLTEINKRLNGIKVNGDIHNRLPGNLNLYFPDIPSEQLMAYLDKYNITISVGSACTSETLEPSHVLKAIGCNSKRVRSSVRISFGKSTTMSDVEYIISKINHFSEIITGAREYKINKVDDARN